MYRRLVEHSRFALAELLLVVLSGAAWIIFPHAGVWFTLLALLPWLLRGLAGKRPFERTPFDWLLLIFLISAGAGYWAAYDKATAWVKLGLILTAVLLYYAVSSQPRRNVFALSLLSFCLGLGVSVYFFLTFDFTTLPGSIALWWSSHQPVLGWRAIHHGYTSGLLVITGLISLYAVRELWRRPHRPSTAALKIFVISGSCLNLLAFLLTMSRGIWAAVAGGLGIWLLWRLTTVKRLSARPGIRTLFPLFVLLYLAAIVIFIYLGPSRVGGSALASYGANTRSDVFGRSAYLLLDYPITGGGLGSFPGLYSQYMLVIPYFYFINSYNMFLDVAIEQGWIGGLAFLLIHLGCLWLLARALLREASSEQRFLTWLALFAVMVTTIHGLFYDYLYNGYITLLLFLPVGFAILGMSRGNEPSTKMANVPLGVTKMTGPKTWRIALLAVLGMLMILGLSRNRIMAMWYANLGAVQMSQVELRDFPSGQWATFEMVPALASAEDSFHSALRYDPDNQTANYRLGRIDLLRQDFESASVYLERAYNQVPGHRGILKNLGYCYGWLGAFDQAQQLLGKIPEAGDELEAYIGWWGIYNRRDLSLNASLLVSRLER